MAPLAFALRPSHALQDSSSLGAKRNLCQPKITPQASRNVFAVVRAAAAPAAPVKERVLEKKVAVKKERQTKQPDMYRLYIYNDPINRRERVVDVLLKTCQGLSFSRAYAAMQEAHENGRGLVLVIAQEIAEHYCATINSGSYSNLLFSGSL